MNATTQPLRKRVIVIKLLCAYLLVAAIYPPFHRGIPGGGSIGDGFGFIFADHGIGRIDIASLAAIWLCGVVVASVILYWIEPGIISLILQSKNRDTNMLKDQLSERLYKMEFDIQTLHIELKDLQKKVDDLRGNQ